MTAILLLLAGYTIQAARHEMAGFFHFTVPGRASFVVFFTAPAAWGAAQLMFITFGLHTCSR